jgi:AGCS family alanine or glycine:cation symporter
MESGMILSFFTWVNNSLLAMPSVIIFFGVGITMTILLRGMQFWAFGRFIHLVTHGVPQKEVQDITRKTDAINSFKALFTAMATTIGVGNVVGPSIAIFVGGPAALFWLVLYMIFGAATKFVEVVLALHTRVQTKEGHLIGGPVQYLQWVHPLFGYWYGIIMIVLFTAFSSFQSNTLANIMAIESIPHWAVGVALAAWVWLVVSGGIGRIASIASALVPAKFFAYVFFALLILCKDLSAVWGAIQMVFADVFAPGAMVGGYVGASALRAMHEGASKAIFISEAGLGTCAIPHAMSNAVRATDQGTLAMFSTLAEIFLAILSGLVVLVSGVCNSGAYRSTLVYEAFSLHAPAFGKYALLFALVLFVSSAVVGNTFNGMQTFISFTQYQRRLWYVFLSCIGIFVGSLISMPLAREITTTLLTLAAIPNLIGITYLAFKHKKLLQE